MAGLWATITAAHALGGSRFGCALDLGLGIAAAALGLLARRRPRPAIVISADQLGFFSLVNGSGRPHLGGLIGDGDGLQTAHWSIRRQRFIKCLVHTPTSCLPRHDFAEALRGGNNGASRVAALLESRRVQE